MSSATTYEGALKIIKTSNVSAHQFSSANFSHGPMAMVDHDTPVLAVVDDHAFTAMTLRMLKESHGESGTPVVATSAIPGRGAGGELDSVILA